jgi:hypothetical protein
MLAMGPVGRGTAHHPHYDIIGDGFGKGYSQDSEMGDDEDSFGHKAIGTSPLVSDKSIPGRCGHDGALANVTQEPTPPQAHHVCHSQPLEVDNANVSQLVQVQGGPNKRADDNAMSPPKTGRSSLRSSSFAPVIVPSPLHANAVDVDPDFLKVPRSLVQDQFPILSLCRLSRMAKTRSRTNSSPPWLQHLPSCLRMYLEY